MLKNKRYILLIATLIVIVTLIYYLESTKVKPNFDIQQSVSETELDNILKVGYEKAPELVGINGYINIDNIKINELRGKVVLIDFWTYSCINCIRTLPYLKSWYDKYNDKGLVIIGVHTPEFEFEKDYNNVKQRVEKFGIKYPVVQDNDYLTWRAFNNRYWPHKYLIDKDGYIRYDHIGEGGYEETEMKIQELLEEMGEFIDLEITKEELQERKPITPETYAGYSFAVPRGQILGNKENYQPEKIINYEDVNEFIPNRIYLQGSWFNGKDDLLHTGIDGKVQLLFTASSVNIVSDSGEEQEIEVLINNNPISREQAGNDILIKDGKSIIKIDEPRLYNIADGDYGGYLLTLKVKNKFQFFAFTFG